MKLARITRTFLFGLICIILLAERSLAQTAVPTIRAALNAPSERKPAPEFALKNAKGRVASLRQYRGRLVLLDFWATWCTGCREEIPQFSELQTKYHSKGLDVIGIGMDDEGWKAIRPFLAKTRVSYLMLAGDQATFRNYGLRGLPDTFLIDSNGRIAAAYVSGLVNQKDLENNVKSLLTAGRR